MEKYSPKISAGKFMEEAVLGKVENTYWHNFEGETQECHEDYDLETMYELVKEHQPYEDPCRPNRRFPRDLLETLGSELGLPEGTRQLRFYTTVNSHLDWGQKGKRGGFDSFIECDIGGGDCVRCNLDISQNEEKITEKENISDRGNKIVFHWPKDGIPQKGKQWFDKVVGVARAVANRLRINAASKGLISIPELNEYELEESIKIVEERRKTLIKTLPQRKN